ncbi:MAG: protein translocase subunit SecD [Lachnospiraceae bacterium]|nr:protein translocase subunit SecD [Lachnospiraceae bacterium]
MNKKRSITKLIIILMAMIAGAYVCVFGINSEKEASVHDIRLGLDLAGGVSITYQVVGEEEPSPEDMADTIYKLQKRVEVYSTEALVYQEGNNRINIEIPGVSDANVILEDLGKPGSLVFMDQEGNVVLNGTDISEAKAATQQDQMGNSEVVVALSMTKEGAVKFAEATRKAAPNREVIYVIYDGEVVSAPVVSTEITDGQCVIQGMADYEEAEKLSSIIRIGGLKLELEELWSKVVGPQLGSYAVETSIKAGVIGVALIIIFMIGVYWIPGVAASLALLIYIVLTVLLLNGFEITLTLPGIAGIILSIGMAVDANVIIFERIREELVVSEDVEAAIKCGFKKALSAIVDGNITTLLAAAVLGFMGTGGIKGFAQTLALGIGISMFTALAVTRIILEGLYCLGLQKLSLYGKAKEAKYFDFIQKRKLFLGISLLVIAVGLGAMGVHKVNGGSILNYSLDFVGGTATTITFEEDLTIEEIDEKVVPVIEKAIGESDILPQKVEGTGDVIIKTRTLSVEERDVLNQALEEQFGLDTDKILTETISSTISQEMKKEALIAVGLATLCMMLYIWMRFSDIRFGASSVMALIHDVLIVVGFYGITRISVGNTFIACILTIVGYSINATIVIFDRIRENRKDNSKMELDEVINVSISQTMKRSIFTSLTTLIMVVILYIMGVSAIKDFALPLIVGILCGGYSSIFLAGSLWYLLKLKFPGGDEEDDDDYI